jgi:glucokinase
MRKREASGGMNITVDFGGTTIKIGLVHKGKVISRTSIPSHSKKGLLQRLSDVESSIRTLLAEHHISLSDCNGIGIATPGLIDATNKTILSINDKFADAVGFSFQDWVDDIFSLRFVLENDARSALLGEVAYGVARGETDAVMMTFGTGVGTAALMNGNILRGRHHQAGILGGHITTDIHGNVCNCGNRGCLEAQASHWALLHSVKMLPTYKGSLLSQASEINYAAVIEASKAGDRTASDILVHLISHWSAGIVNLIHAYDPDIVILSGGLMKSKEYILPLLQERIYQLAWTPWGKVRFAVAEEPDTSVLLGLDYLLENN